MNEFEILGLIILIATVLLGALIIYGTISIIRAINQLTVLFYDLDDRSYVGIKALLKLNHNINLDTLYQKYTGTDEEEDDE